MMSQILNSAVFPGIQGGPLEHVIAAKAVAFGEALEPSYKEYQAQVQKNARAMAEAFVKRGYKIVSGGTDNHLMLVDLRTKFPELTGKLAEKCLVAADITTNKNMVPFDSRSPFQTSGLRFGTPAITTRGLKEDKMDYIVGLIDRVLHDPENEANIAAVRKDVNALMADYPLFAGENSGRMKEVIDFFRRLHDNNDRAWFDAHRTEWAHVKGYFAAFTEQLIAGIAEFDPTVRGLRVQDCTYRIARDTRFSPDKSPYKTYIGAYIAPKGKKSGFAGCSSPHRTLLRQPRMEQPAFGGALLPRAGRAAQRARGDPRQRCGNRGGHPQGQGVRHRRRERSSSGVPTGFPADSEYAEMLKLKDFYIAKKITEEFLLSDDLLERTLAEFRRTQPFIAILNRAVQFAYEEMM